MRNLLTLILSVTSLLLFAQNNRNILSEIDSISQQRWNAVSLDVDSLANPTFEKFKVQFKDTIVIFNKVDLVKTENDIPVTPYNLLQLKDPIKWFYYGQNNLVFNQSSFSNWNSGGNSNIGIIGKINYNLSYKNGLHFLDNNLQLAMVLFLLKQNLPVKPKITLTSWRIMDMMSVEIIIYLLGFNFYRSFLQDIIIRSHPILHLMIEFPDLCHRDISIPGSVFYIIQMKIFRLFFARSMGNLLL